MISKSIVGLEGLNLIRIDQDMGFRNEMIALRTDVQNTVGWQDMAYELAN